MIDFNHKLLKCYKGKVPNFILPIGHNKSLKQRALTIRSRMQGYYCNTNPTTNSSTNPSSNTNPSTNSTTNTNPSSNPTIRIEVKQKISSKNLSITNNEELSSKMPLSTTLKKFPLSNNLLSTNEINNINSNNNNINNNYSNRNGNRTDYKNLTLKPNPLSVRELPNHNNYINSNSNNNSNHYNYNGNTSSSARRVDDLKEMKELNTASSNTNNKDMNDAPKMNFTNFIIKKTRKFMLK